MKKYYTLLLIFGIQLLSAQDLRVVGYLPYYRFDNLELIDFSQITHLNVAFANPKSSGTLYIPSGDVDAVVAKARANNVIPFISMGGGLTTPWKATYKKLMTKEKTPAFCQKIKDYCLEHDFDGVDFDLEWSNVTELYSDFVITLRDTLDNYNLGFTAALPGSTRYDNITDKALRVFDVVNMMVYDYKGPWDPSNPGQHSPYGKAVEAISYWTGQGMPLSKLTLGLPFYGYDFTSSSNVKSFTYASIVEDNPANAQKSQVGKKYYNGIPTINAKTKLAIKKNLLGVMIWELGQDALGDNSQYSLLNAINKLIPIQSDNIFIEQDNILVYPNPFSQFLSFESSIVYSDDVEFMLIDVNGAVVRQEIRNFNNKVTLEFGDIPSGMYFYKIVSKQGMSSGRVMKM